MVPLSIKKTGKDTDRENATKVEGDHSTVTKIQHKNIRDDKAQGDRTTNVNSRPCQIPLFRLRDFFCYLANI